MNDIRAGSQAPAWERKTINAVGAGLVPALGNHKPVLSIDEGGLPLHQMTKKIIF